MAQIKIPIELPDDWYGKVADKLIEKGFAIPYVKCEECAYYKRGCVDSRGKTYNRCEHPALSYDVECYDMWLETEPDDYCSYGERRSEE